LSVLRNIRDGTENGVPASGAWSHGLLAAKAMCVSVSWRNSLSEVERASKQVGRSSRPEVDFGYGLFF